MTHHDDLTIEHLIRFTPFDWEAYRERGEDFRVQLTAAVLHYISVPDVWSVDYEFRQEWGGEYPALLRLTHPLSERLVVEISAPGEAYPCWQLRVCRPGGLCHMLLSQEGFRPDILRDALDRIDAALRAGLRSPKEIMAVVRMAAALENAPGRGLS